MEKVLLGMSGGTDSSVAAMLLQDAGYEVVGITFRFYESDDTSEYLEDASSLARQLSIKHLVYDARNIFRKVIIDYFIEEYMAGRTPVPCTICNNCLKWPLLKEIADEMGIRYLATGHYVQKIYKDGKYYITCGVDPDKDQSFFLWGLKQDILSRMLLPMGNLTKLEVREFAFQRGFMKVARKRDSIGVCFCPRDYRSFLRKELGEDERIAPGIFKDEKGNYIGIHAGYPFYTIGQRHGLGIHLNRPVFVKEIFPDENCVVLGSFLSLEKREMWLKQWNITDKSLWLGQEDVIVKIRYRKQANHCRVTLTSENTLHIRLYEPLTAVACGQAAAFYRGNVLLGGGIIYKAE